VTSVTDSTVAPEGCENLFFLIPIAADLQGDDEATRDKYFEKRYPTIYLKKMEI